jgi:hypothetical protein
MLRSASDTIHGLADQHASTTVRALHAAPGSAPIPADAHQTVKAVAALLTQQHDGAVTLTTRHEEGAYEDDPDDGYGCGCDVTIVSDGEEYNFHRGDSEWSLTREPNGRKQSDGSTVYNAWEPLDTALMTAHPQQLTDGILRVMAANRT